MKFFVATLCTVLVAGAIAYPYGTEFDQALEFANAEDSIRVQRNIGYGQQGGYGQPSKGGYSAPSKGGYGGGSSYGGGQSYGGGVQAYSVPSPKVQCGHNLLLSCAPSVAKVPCQPSKGGYGGSSYGGQSSGGYGGGSYKAQEAEAEQAQEMGYYY